MNEETLKQLRALIAPYFQVNATLSVHPLQFEIEVDEFSNTTPDTDFACCIVNVPFLPNQVWSFDFEKDDTGEWGLTHAPMVYLMEN